MPVQIPLASHLESHRLHPLLEGAQAPHDLRVSLYTSFAYRETETGACVIHTVTSGTSHRWGTDFSARDRQTKEVTTSTGPNQCPQRFTSLIAPSARKPGRAARFAPSWRREGQARDSHATNKHREEGDTRCRSCQSDLPSLAQPPFRRQLLEPTRVVQANMPQAITEWAKFHADMSCNLRAGAPNLPGAPPVRTCAPASPEKFHGADVAFS